MKIPSLPRRARSGGFTLVELMVTVAITGILAAVAYPSYTSYIVRTQRSKASSCVAEMAQFMERVYATNLVYNQNNGVATVLPASQCRTDIASRYTLSFASGQPTARTFAVQAVPQGQQASADATCGTLSLSQTGAKTISGSGTVASCWK
jgi:type IV pilus assembly protein PilE